MNLMRVLGVGYVDSYLDINIADEKLKVYDYSSDYVPAAAAEVAKVIYVDDVGKYPTTPCANKWL